MTDHSPIYNSRLLKFYVAYLDSHYPKIDVDSFLKEVNFSKLEIEDPGHWFNQEQVDLFYDKVVEATNNPNIARDVGRYTVSTDAAGAVKQHVLGLLNISSIYMLTAKLYPMLSRGAVVKAKKMARNRVEITVTPKPGVKEKNYQCANRMGTFESLSTLFTAKHAVISHDQCIHRGDRVCCYDVSWEEPGYRRWQQAFFTGAIAAAVATLSALLIDPANLLPVVFPVSVAGLMGLRFQADRLEKQELIRTIQKQGNVAEDHIREIDYRYRGALLVQKIGQATSELLDLNQLAQVVMENIENYLDFDRGIIMLADEKYRRLAYAAGFGFDRTQTQILRNTRFRLDNPDAKGLFFQVFDEQRPILVDDVNAMLESLSSRSQGIAKQIGSKSLICLPIVYESRSLGVLAADNIVSKRQLTQSDINLLMGVAYQTAVSIFSTSAYKKLQASEERYRSLYDNAPSAYFSIDAQKAAIINCNVAATHLLGKTREQLIGTRWMDHFADEQGKYSRARWIYQALKEGKSINGEEVRLIHPDGHNIWADLTMTAHRDIEGNVIEGRCVLIDITERKMLEENLQRAQKMEAMGMLAGGVAHDLSNILAAIVSYPDLLLMDIDKESRLYDPLIKIQMAGLRATAIVQDLLTLARRGVQIKQVIDLNSIVTDFIKGPEFESLSRQHPGVQVATHLASQLDSIKASAVHITKTLMNVLNNAAEAMPDGGRIEISTYNQVMTKKESIAGAVEGNYVVLSVKDSGTGIAKEDLERIFEPFFTTKVMGRSGTGLGMAIVWATIRDHKGRVDVESDIGKGTTVRLFFPATMESLGNAGEAPVIQDVMGRGESILVVDDQQDHLEIASQMLTRLGYKVTTVNSADETLEKVRVQQPDLLLLDMVLGTDVDGLALYRRVLGIHPDQKAVVVSGYTEPARIRQVLALGAGGHLKKPYSLKELSVAIRNELDRS